MRKRCSELDAIVLDSEEIKGIIANQFNTDSKYVRINLIDRSTGQEYNAMTMNYLIFMDIIAEVDLTGKMSQKACKSANPEGSTEKKHEEK